MKTNTNSDSRTNRTAQRMPAAHNCRGLTLPRRHSGIGDCRRNRFCILSAGAPAFWELAEVVGKWVWIQFDGKQPSQYRCLVRNSVSIGTGGVRSGSIRAARLPLQQPRPAPEISKLLPCRLVTCLITDFIIQSFKFPGVFHAGNSCQHNTFRLKAGLKILNTRGRFASLSRRSGSHPASSRPAPTFPASPLDQLSGQ